MLAALLWWGGAEAQDVILLRNADEVKAEVREITDSHILYTLWGGSDKVLSLPRAEVFSVTYQNGEKELFVGDDSGATGPVTAADYPWPRVTKRLPPGRSVRRGRHTGNRYLHDRQRPPRADPLARTGS